MSRKINIILMALFCGLLPLTYGQSCEVCMSSNDAYCIDETRFYLCLDGNPLTSTAETCQPDHVCTDSENICEPKVKTDGTTTAAACSSGCNKCPAATAANKRYGCVSKTQFGRCVNDEITIISSCAADTYCSAELYEATGKICAPKCVGDFFGHEPTCSNDDITTTTTTTTTQAPAPTPSTQNLKDQCKAGQIAGAKYFYVRNTADKECQSYIYCEPYGNEMDAFLIKCTSGYYDSSTNKCVETKPAECITVQKICQI